MRGTGGSEFYNSILWVRAAVVITGRDLSRDRIDKTSIDSHKLPHRPEYPAAVVDSVDFDGRELKEEPGAVDWLVSARGKRGRK